MTLQPNMPLNMSPDGPERRSLLRQLWPWLRPFRRAWWTAMLAAMLASTAQVLGPVVLGKVLIDQTLMGQSPPSAGADLGQGALVRGLCALLPLSSLAATVLLLLAWGGLAVGMGHWYRHTLVRAALQALQRLRRDVLDHLMHLPPAFFDQQTSGQLATRVTQDVDTLSQTIIGLTGLLGELVPFALALIVALRLDPVLTAELSPLLILLVMASVVFRRLAGPIYREARQLSARLNEHLSENLLAIETVQLFNRQAFNRRQHAELVDHVRRNDTQAFIAETSYYPLIENVWNLSVALVLWLGARHVGAGEVTLGAVVMFVQLTDLLFKPIVELGIQMDALLRAGIAADRLFGLLHRADALRLDAPPAVLPARLGGHITLHQLQFGYHPDQPVLHGLRLDIQPGEHVALVGATGSGKTTVARLICRFYDVPAGQLFIDGIDVMRMPPAELRKRIGIVLQDSHVFPGTVHDNIALGRPDLGRDAVREAARQAQALEFILALPQGFDTVLDAHGQALSQGQRQLITLARVMARNPDILILDEATAHIDRATEQALQHATQTAMRGRTTLVIAHRLDTITHMDRIVVMQAGSIVQQGPHARLSQIPGAYRDLLDAHMSDLSPDL